MAEVIIMPKLGFNMNEGKLVEKVIPFPRENPCFP